LIKAKIYTGEVAGRALTIETGKLARQANAAVTVSYGGTVVLVTVSTSAEIREDADFLPLTVDYEERLYAAGKIPGGFLRREGRSQSAVLACRLIDRALRPLLPKAWRQDIQIVVTVLSADQENDPNILGIIGGSAALAISDIPFDGPVSAVNVGYINDEFVLNPTLAQLGDSRLDLVVAGTGKAVVMLEAGAREVSNDTMAQAVKFGHEANQNIIALLKQVQEACGKPKAETPVIEIKREVTAAISPLLNEKLPQVFNISGKLQRQQAVSQLKQELIENLGESFAPVDITAAFEAKIKAEVRSNILNKGQRIDGRNLTTVRPLSCEVGLLPRTHGSGLFTRGETQVLTITTLGSLRQEQQIDGLGIEESKRFIHHYNFPPFSTGETGRIGAPKRREIGHGALAERAIVPVLPEDADFPYTIRLVSEVLSSNGSTSMASVCASSLSLMDAGVPTKKGVAGVAMGLVTGENGEFAILTDIEGSEDAYGDMDFKVAGTNEGITALQLDIKLKGISPEILAAALKQGSEAYRFILATMQQTIGSSRSELSPHAPRMYKITVDPDKIGSIIGSGGKTIRSITEETKTTIDIDNDGTVVIGSTDAQSAQRAIDIIKSLTEDAEVGSIYTGKVTRILNFGAMVEILPGKEGLVHISELDDRRVEKVEDVVKIGDEITVKVIDIDNLGRVNLSRRALFEKLPSSSASRSKETSEASSPPRQRRTPHNQRSNRWQHKR